MKRTLILAALVISVASMLSAQTLVNKAGAAGADTLIVSRSVYEGKASTVTIGETLPLGCQGGLTGLTVNVPTTTGGTTAVTVPCGVATDNGEYPNLFDSHNVWNNANSDGSFGVTSPIFLDNITTDGRALGTLPIPTDQIVTSFSSKSELALNRSVDGRSITFMGYVGGIGCGGSTVSPTAPNLLDVSASNTPGVCDPTNPVITTFQSNPVVPAAYYRAVAEVDADGHLSITDGNAYSGDNGRAAIKGGNGLYYMVGNDNSGNLSKKQMSTTHGRHRSVQCHRRRTALSRADAAASARHRDDRAPGVRHRQARQRHQLPRPHHLQQHPLRQQGQRQQWHQHRLSGGHCRYLAHRLRRRSGNRAADHPAGISQHRRQHNHRVSLRHLVRRRQHALCLRRGRRHAGVPRRSMETWPTPNPRPPPACRNGA